MSHTDGTHRNPHLVSHVECEKLPKLKEYDALQFKSLLTVVTKKCEKYVDFVDFYIYHFPQSKFRTSSKRSSPQVEILRFVNIYLPICIVLEMVLWNPLTYSVRSLNYNWFLHIVHNLRVSSHNPQYGCLPLLHSIRGLPKNTIHNPQSTPSPQYLSVCS